MRQADRIVVLELGRIAEMWSHEELTSRGGYYGEITLPRRS
jgi:ABC-type multidrug transport system fused ATPase/permease subunit